MNFARQQEQAERTARRLTWLHGFASAAVVIGVDALATLAWHLLFGAATEPPNGFHAVNIGVVLALIAGGAWLETSRLREDGALIARRLGAVAVDTLGDPLHRRLQNLLEELAIAARIGVPRAFVLEDEPTINALTAGMDRNQAVVVVTRGALVRLSRDELQGVLAHEVSHIVNGDVRLNTRLLGMNHGLQWVALFGRSMLSPALRSADAKSGLDGLLALPLALIGAIVVAVGALGELAALAIQAGIGRQREYFADAQAVAFTRQRDGLGGALRKVAGLPAVLAREAAAAGAAQRDPRRAAALRHPYWQNVSHLLLVGRVASGRWFETHPPLRERVRRLYGRDMTPVEPPELSDADRREPELPAVSLAVSAGAALDDEERSVLPGSTRAGTAALAFARMRGADGPAPGALWADTLQGLAKPSGSGPAAALPGAGAVAPGGVAASPGDVIAIARVVAADPAGAPAIAEAADRLVRATREPAGAAALVAALVGTPGQPAPRWDEGWACAAQREESLRAAVAAVPVEVLRGLRWPLMELAVARLQPLSRPARESLLTTVRGVVDHDARLTLPEWIYVALLRLRLRLEPRRAGGLRRAGSGDALDARGIRVLFALVAHCAHVSEAKADRAANAAIRALDLAPIGASAGPLTIETLEHAMRGAALLPPLARPLLVRHLVSLLPPDAGQEVRDFLRLLCVAIDTPPPRLPPHGPVWAATRAAGGGPSDDQTDEVLAGADA
ncbi:MAG: M48 family metalloprotease [Burkholderiales bacterium]|nr:M48 family metalloprotease [Burkholderiales bacterium]